MHKCISKLTIIGSDNGLLSGWHETIIWTNAGISLAGPLRINFIEILIEICTVCILSQPQCVKTIISTKTYLSWIRHTGTKFGEILIKMTNNFFRKDILKYNLQNINNLLGRGHPHWREFIIWPDTRPTNDILIEFEIWAKFGVLRFEMCFTDHNNILHISRNCHDMCKILLWSVKYILN